jgi:hypothetical protein
VVRQAVFLHANQVGVLREQHIAAEFFAVCPLAAGAVVLWGDEADVRGDDADGAGLLPLLLRDIRPHKGRRESTCGGKHHSLCKIHPRQNGVHAGSMFFSISPTT